MSDQPIDLRSLADVDSPDVLRAALRTFRRRTLVRSLWGLFVGALGVAAVYAAVQPHALPDKITSASLVAHPQGAVWDFGDERIALADVARLGDYLGLHLVVVAPPGSSLAARTFLTAKRMVGLEEKPGSVDHWIEVRRPPDGIIRVDIFRTGQCTKSNPCMGSFEIDLAALGVPEEIWR